MAKRQLNATAASLLGFLHEGPMTGWELAGKAEQTIGDFWSLTQSQVYRELKAMADDGLVVAGERGTRDRRPYSITDAGRKAFAEWIDQRPGEETIRFPLLLTIVFGAHLPPERLASFVRSHRAIHAARLDEYEHTMRAIESALNQTDIQQLPDDAVFRVAVLQFGIAYERAVLSWFDALPDRIRNPALTDQND